MKLISWNIRGLGSSVKKRFVSKSVRDRNPEVLMIQEMKVESLEEGIIKKMWGNPDVEFAESGLEGYKLIVSGNASGHVILTSWFNRSVTLMYPWTSLCEDDSSFEDQCFWMLIWDFEAAVTVAVFICDFVESLGVVAAISALIHFIYCLIVGKIVESLGVGAAICAFTTTAFSAMECLCSEADNLMLIYMYWYFVA
ncbi:hypothetical protein Vadar_007453 [Vaccinium darrowii]|uniref:Uncharacterized protein n=1 Tax=Vaccinium darrowii TaxID=229202 RepID=A0ACB7ZA35_9ERIC|nr:hypothetical protein Vadar_007453 [Vaccinium darrowii]